MKTNFIKIKQTGRWAILLFLTITIAACSSDDDGPSNQAPDKAILLNPSNQAKDLEASEVELKWQATTDPDGDAVSYDIYLDTIHPPEAKIMGDISETSLKLTEDIEFDKTYYWSVVAKDESGAESNSNIGVFSTREQTTAELLIGKWIITGVEHNSNPEDFECLGKSYFQFDPDGKLTLNIYSGATCNDSSSAVFEFILTGGNTITASRGTNQYFLSILSITKTSLRLLEEGVMTYQLERE